MIFGLNRSRLQGCQPVDLLDGFAVEHNPRDNNELDFVDNIAAQRNW